MTKNVKKLMFWDCVLAKKGERFARIGDLSQKLQPFNLQSVKWMICPFRISTLPIRHVMRIKEIIRSYLTIIP